MLYHADMKKIRIQHGMVVVLPDGSTGRVVFIDNNVARVHVAQQHWPFPRYENVDIHLLKKYDYPVEDAPF